MRKLSINRNIVAASVVTALGLAAVITPVVAQAADTTINSQIGSVVSLFTTSGTVDVNVTPTAAGAQTIAKDTVTVSTNGPGYTLQLANKDTNTSLVSGSNTIQAATGTQAAPAALTAGQWGYRVDGVGGFGAGPTSATSSAALSNLTFAGVPASGSANTLKNTSTSATNDITSVWYSVAADTNQASGLYTDIVTYTAVSNN